MSGKNGHRSGGRLKLERAAAAALPQISGRASTLFTEPLEKRVLMAFTALVNFQPAGVPVPSGYVADTGAVYGSRGNGLTYGWNADNSANTRDRDDSSSDDQQHDTFIHSQKNGTFSWDIA